MSVEIEAADVMLQSLDSLKKTTLPMHKLYFEVTSVDQWYAIMQEARSQFGSNWRGQRHVRRRLESRAIWRAPNYRERVWFEVPDLRFGTWIAIKHAIQQTDAGK